jgi:hypothetical protein
MTDQVYLPDSSFQHDALHLTTPNGIQGGAYFSMLYYKNEPLYIQTPICTSKNGIVYGKRNHIDLMFTNNETIFLEWIEMLEANAIRLIYEKKNLWINSDVEKTDIENGFTSLIRPYKGGKYYLMRAHIQPTNKFGTSGGCSFFDENERPVSIEYIKPEHQMYAIIELQGIKFTSRSFQIELSLKQILVVSNTPLFKSCIVKRPSKKDSDTEPVSLRDSESLHSNLAVMLPSDLVSQPQPQPLNLIPQSQSQPQPQSQPLDLIPQSQSQPQPQSQPLDLIPQSQSQSQSQSQAQSQSQSQSQPQPQPDLIPQPQTLDLVPQPQTSDLVPQTSDLIPQTSDSIPIHQIQNQNKDLEEINLDIEENDNSQIKLKKPAQFYHDLYLTAKLKAKELKKSAIEAYLKAKEIKSIHILNNSSSSGSEDSDSNEN